LFGCLFLYQQDEESLAIAEKCFCLLHKDGQGFNHEVGDRSEQTLQLGVCN